MIPSYEEIMLPLLKFLSDENEHSLSEAQDNLAKHFNLSESELRERLPSGTQPVFRNRLGWARTYLKKAGLVESTKRAHFKITERGKKLLEENPKSIDAKFLNRYEEFQEFKSNTNSKINNEKTIEEIDEKTPEEILEIAHQNLKSSLIHELLEIIKSGSPAFFENLIVDLVLALGYGGSKSDAGRAMGKSGDGGIDGIIKEDKLGLDIIYLQAKKWEGTVPIKEIRDFTGALASKRAKKGIFITTSNFPNSAYEFVKNLEYKIILIDGELLAEYMIEHNVGVSTTQTYFVKNIDSDYFEEN